MKVAIFQKNDRSDLEGSIQAFLNTKHIKDFYVVQSQSEAAGEEISITISIFYNEESY